MGLSDEKRLQSLYEVTVRNRTDILVNENISVENDWDFVWNRFTLCNNACFELYEKLEIISSSDTQDSYELTTTNNLKFKIFINFINKSLLDNRLLNAAMFNKDKKLYTQLINAVKKTSNPIMNVFFADEADETKLTNLVKNFTFAVFGGVKDAIENSLSSKYDNPPDVVFVDLDKQEPRRLRIYKKFFGPAFGWFPNELVIDIPNERHQTVWFWRNS